jgi:Ca2+-binding RTX toxin-like protein
VIGGPGADRLLGNDTFTLASYQAAPGPVTVDLFGETSSGAHGPDTLIDIAAVQGSDHDDTLTGDPGTNYLFGGDGNDQISSGSNSGSFGETSDNGSDEVFEFDFMGGDGGDDTITGGAGLQVVDFTSSDEPVDVDLTSGVATGDGNDTISEVNVVIGSFLSDVLTGDDEGNGFEGGGGSDTIDGQDGTDVAIFFAAQPEIDVNLAEGTATAQYVRTSRIGVEADTSTDSMGSVEDVWGSSGDDEFFGDDSANGFFGFRGNDSFNGEAGDDTLRGGPGFDDANGGHGDDVCEAEGEINCELDPSAGAQAGISSTIRSTQVSPANAWSEKRSSGTFNSYGARSTGITEAMIPRFISWLTIANGS